MTEQQRGWLLPPLAVCFSLGILIGRSASSVYYGITGCITGFSAFLLLKGRARFYALLVLFLALGYFRGYQQYHPILPDEGMYRVSGIIQEDLKNGDNGSFRTVLTDVRLNDKHYNSNAYWSFYDEDTSSDLIPGTRITLLGKLYHPSGASNPGGYDFREDLFRRGINIGIYGRSDLKISASDSFTLSGFTSSLRYRLQELLNVSLGEEAGTWASAMLLGTKSLLPREDREAFSRLGVAHILTISGFHTSVLAAMLALLFRLFHLPQKIRFLLFIVFLSLYCILCGWSLPVLRASLLLLFGLWGRILNRPRILLHLLSAALLVLLFLYPAQLSGLSFQMSFGAVLGIALIYPFLRSLWKPKYHLLRWLRNTLAVGIGAQFGVILPMLHTYQELPLLGILANIPMILLSTGLIWLYWLTLLMLPIPILSGFFSSLAQAGTRVMLVIVRALGNLPGITLWTREAGLLTLAGVVLLGLGICAIIRFRPRIRILLSTAGLILITISLFPSVHLTTEYYQFDEGNADSAVLWDQDQVIIMDAGNRNGFLSSFLRRHRLTPDAVILSHLHSDHISGLESMMEDRIPIPLVYIPEGADRADVHPDTLLLLDLLKKNGTEIRTLKAGDTISLSSGNIHVIWPEKGKTRPGQNANESSLVMQVELMGTVLLQTGDLDGRYEMYAAAQADLLKAAHHGSANSSSQAFLAAIKPQAVLLSCDDIETPAAFQRRIGDIKLFSTAANGMLTVHFRDHTFFIETFLNTPEVTYPESN